MTEPRESAPPPRAAFTIVISIDPKTQARPDVYVAVLGEGAAYDNDLLQALQMARDQMIAQTLVTRNEVRA